MAALIPAIGTCVSNMTGGERRLAYRLEQKLEDDWLLWYDVPLGPRNVHPDFVVFNPRRGLLVLEVKDWKLDTIRDIDRQSASILTPNGLKRVANPLEQARQYAHEVSNLLQRDPQLTINSGRMQGTLLFPWSYGVVLANISRK
ncbi:nuclease-related domain-containing protein [Ferribacterium limneticum]|uniref:nuclease-related domain-containing protein n=1 Tax=Ferribacterium limneticum TaxID=76259 RepID=UPI001CF8C742|nr:nuclease-related domain-containing protein [Ferribacterium limneticum]UCV24082.1 NERD domain-containing protein [Ferribacterium limneticum]